MRFRLQLTLAFIFAGVLCISMPGSIVFARQNQDQSVIENDESPWPQWRGPLWNGVAPQADPPLRLNPTTNLRWQVPIDGFGHGTPIVWGDFVFLQTAVELDRKLPVPDVIPKGTPNIKVNPDESIVSWKAQRFEFLCLDRKTGKVLWRRKVFEGMPHQGHHFKGSFASQSPVTDGQKVYAYFGSYGFYCFDFSGKLIWKHDPRPQAMEAGLGEGSSPAIQGDKLILVVDQESQSYIVAIDKNSGKEIWRRNRDEPSNWSTPRIFEHQGRHQVLVNGVILRSYDLETGQELWTCGGHTASAIPMPSVGHGMVFNASGWSKDFLQAIKLGRRGDLTGSDQVAWSLNRGSPYVPCPMLWGKELYVLEDSNFFSCYNALNGRRHYKFRARGKPLEFSASPVGAGDRIYLLSEGGTLVVIKRGTEAKVLAISQIDEKFFASPAIVGNEIFLRGHKSLYCFCNLRGENQTDDNTKK